MDYNLERRYFLERLTDFVRALEETGGEVQRGEADRMFFTVAGRPFEILAWINEDHDLICITTRSADLAVTEFKDAVQMLEATLRICWEHCVAVSPVDNRYELSMALFAGGCTFEAFEGVVYNLIACAEAIEEHYKTKTMIKGKE